MSDAHRDRVWQIIDKVGVGMLTTQSPTGLRARPVEPRPDRAVGAIFVVTDRRSGKEHEIETAHDVGLTVLDSKAGAYLSITGRAEVLSDHAKAAEIWRFTDNLWWHGPDDPHVCVLRITPLIAELWDGPASTAVAAFRAGQRFGRRHAEPRREPQGNRVDVLSGRAAAERARGRNRYRRTTMRESAMAATDTDRIWELTKKIAFCMLATWDGKELHARPMGAYVHREDNAIYFLTNADRAKTHEIERYRKVCLAFADTGAQKYVSLSGQAEILDDRSLV
jgi:general stress protein 26